MLVASEVVYTVHTTTSSIQYSIAESSESEVGKLYVLVTPARAAGVRRSRPHGLDKSLNRAIKVYKTVNKTCS